MARSTKQRGIYQCPDGSWEVDCQYRKRRIRKRGFSDHRSAQNFLTQQKAEILQGGITAPAPSITLEHAATRYLQEKLDKAMPSAATDAYLLMPVVEHLGSLTLEEIGDDTVAPFIAARRADGIKNKSINNALAIINRICKLANSRWRHPDRRPWLSVPARVELLDLADRRLPRPISWQEQRTLLEHLPAHLVDMALFCLSSGVRKNVVCQLRWQWEVSVSIGQGQKISVFVVPREYVKGRKGERVLMFNSVGQDIINAQRGKHPERVFTYHRPLGPKSRKSPTYVPISDMNNTAWQRARAAAGLDDLRVHDLRHTVGMRLRLAGVPERTQDEILWHSTRTMTAHYAVAQIREVYEALELIKQEGVVGETLNLLAIAKRASLTTIEGKVPQKSPAQRKTA